MDIGNRLKQLRLDKNLKQSELAEILGVSTSAIGSYERLERQCSYELLHKYAKCFNVSIDYILCHSDDKHTIDQYLQLATLDLQSEFAKRNYSLNGVELSSDEKRRILDIATVLLFERLAP